MAAETNIVDSRPQTLGGADENFFIDLGADSINVIKSLYFSTTSGNDITKLNVSLSPDGVALQDLIFASPDPIPADTGINIVPLGSSFIVKPPLRYIAFTVNLPITGQVLKWAVNYITFPSTNAPLLDKFNYAYLAYTNQTTQLLLTAPADVSTIIQSVSASRIGADGNPDASIRLAINAIPITEPVVLSQPSTITFSQPIYLTPGDQLLITQPAGSIDPISVATSYIVNT